MLVFFMHNLLPLIFSITIMLQKETIIMKCTSNFILLILLLPNTIAIRSQPILGRLANPGFENQCIKSAFFFAGNWRNGMQFYDYKPSDNTGLYTMHPSDFRHLGWSENASYRNFAVQTMIDAGVNVINMSYWGPRGTDNWAFWSPMQTSTFAHDELFTAAIGKKILIAPYIESFAPTDSSEGYVFRDCFPGDSLNPAPQLVAMIEELVDRYLTHPSNTKWPKVWAHAYDQDGIPRYIISLIHVASNQAGITDQSFAEGFDRVADKVFDSTGIRVGFLLDALPVANYSPGNYKITPENAESWLSSQKSILGIQCFIPEIWTGFDNDVDLIAWKRDLAGRWSKTAIPFITDVSPGYDAHVVFPQSMIYGNNQAWRDSLTQIVRDIRADGITVNTWNGYTEGFAVVPTLEYDDANYIWTDSLLSLYTIPGNPGDIENIQVTGSNIFVYPNPARNVLFIKSNHGYEGNHYFELYSIRGDLIRAGELNEDSEITMQNLSKGVYMLKLTRGTISVQPIKVIIN